MSRGHHRLEFSQYTFPHASRFATGTAPVGLLSSAWDCCRLNGLLGLCGGANMSITKALGRACRKSQYGRFSFSIYLFIPVRPSIRQTVGANGRRFEVIGPARQDCSSLERG
jgi:hypothetical protein